MSSSSSSSHELILTSSPDGPITVYDATSYATLTRFAPSRSPRRGLAVAGKMLVAASHVSLVTASASVRLYKWWSAAAFHTLPVPEPVAPVAAAPGGDHLFAGGVSGGVYVLSVLSGCILRKVAVHGKPVSCLHVTHDGSLLISGGDDGTVVFIPILQLVGSEKTETDTDQWTLHKFAAHTEAVTAITSGEGLCNSQIITSSSDCTCKFWSLLRGTHLRTVTFPCPVTAITLSPSGSEFYAAGYDGSVHGGSVKLGKSEERREPVKWSRSHKGPIVSLAMINNGTNLVSASEDGSVWVWRADLGEVVFSFGGEIRSGISDMIVVNGMSFDGEFGPRMRGCDGDGGIGGRDVEVTGGIPVKETMEMEGALAMAEEDRSRAIDLLESSMTMYERLLELILKELSRRNNGET